MPLCDMVQNRAVLKNWQQTFRVSFEPWTINTPPNRLPMQSNLFHLKINLTKHPSPPAFSWGGRGLTTHEISMEKCVDSSYAPF